MATPARLSTQEAAARLGIRPQSLYAYVSRGFLTSQRGADGRSSTFDAGEVDRLAQKGRGGRARSVAVDVAISTALTLLADDDLRYRGMSATSLSRHASYEEVAEWLWAEAEETPAWVADKAAVEVARQLQQALPVRTSPVDRLTVVVPAIAALDHMRGDLRPVAVMASARALIASTVESLPVRARARQPKDASLAARLSRRLFREPPTERLVEFVNAMMVLLADHELATSTLAVRVAASTRADPYSVVLSGLGALRGPLHGSAGAAVHRMLVDIERARAAGPVIGARLRNGEALPGFGHRVYKYGDPRATELLARLRSARMPARKLAVLNDTLSVAAQRVPVHPNVDFAGGAFSFCADLEEDATEVIFSIARMAGWIAHALEEYEEAPLRFRARAEYVGRKEEP